MKESLGAMANEMAGKWGTGAIDTEEIEKNSDLTLDGGLDFNSGWNFSYRRGCGQCGKDGDVDKWMQVWEGYSILYYSG